MLFWIDTETSGLRPDYDNLLEFVCVVTDNDLRIVDTFGPFTVQPSVLGRPITDWDDVVIKMHSTNGLITDIHEGKVISPEELDRNCLDWLQLEYKIFEGKAPMAGSTIGFDRAFMKHWMPDTEKFFHYRSIDISSVKELCRVWNPLVFDLRPTVPDEDKAHRALPDIMATIDEAVYYKNKFFRTEEIDPVNPDAAK